MEPCRWSGFASLDISLSFWMLIKKLLRTERLSIIFFSAPTGNIYKYFTSPLYLMRFAYNRLEDLQRHRTSSKLNPESDPRWCTSLWECEGPQLLMQTSLNSIITRWQSWKKKINMSAEGARWGVQMGILRSCTTRWCLRKSTFTASGPKKRQSCRPSSWLMGRRPRVWKPAGGQLSASQFVYL